MSGPKTDYRRLMDDEIARVRGIGREAGTDRPPSLLLHSCCGPCSTAVITELAPDFRLTVFYYNPNIDTAGEYARRAAEQRRAISLLAVPHPVEYLDEGHLPGDFLPEAEPLASEPEGGARCSVCFRIRLERTAVRARELGFDWFCSTLTVSPHKDAPRINAIGTAVAARVGVRWLPSDFKKRDGYGRSIALSREFGLYRQDYCGCLWSREARPE